MSNFKENDMVECDVREDEEQNFKLQQIIDLLVAAGYFRARIKGLSAFDKVVGGMIWSMDSCNYEVNVDLLFHENLTIGHKIALTEKLVTVLPKMECPHRIEPHQIQGLDFIHVFPVIQWLVKKSVKIREERKGFIRNHAILKYEGLLSTRYNIQQPIKNIFKIQEKYRRRRLFKRKDNLPNSKELQVESTLFEYGYPFTPLKNETCTNSQNSFSETQEFTGFIPTKIMGNIVNSQVQQIVQVSEQFAKLRADFEKSGTSLIKKQKDMITEKRLALLEEEKQLEKEVEVHTQKMLSLKENLKQFEEANFEKNEKQLRVYERLQRLLSLEENLKNQEHLFREHCRKELDNFQNLVRDANERNQFQERNLADNQCDEEREKIKILKLQIAKKNRSVAFLQRQLDEIPGRGELAQYQRRFLELYNEVAQKHEETKQFYTMYNTLDDTKLYLSKELSLLNSVLDNYSEAMSNSIDREEFMKQFESIVLAIKQNKHKVEKRKAEERNRRDNLSRQLIELVEQQRNYVNVVKQLRIECKKNEELLGHFRKP